MEYNSMNRIKWYHLNLNMNLKQHPIDPLCWKSSTIAEGTFSVNAAVFLLLSLFSVIQWVYNNVLDWGKDQKGDFLIFRIQKERSCTLTTPLQRNSIFTLKGRLMCYTLASPFSLLSFLLCSPPVSTELFPQPGRRTITQICHPGNPDTLFPLRQRASDGWWVCSCWGIWQTRGE